MRAGPRGRQPSASGSTAGGGGQRVGAGGPPGAPPVQLDRRLVLQHRVGDAPLLLDAVGAARLAVVALHGVLEQPLIGLLAVREQRVVRHLEVDGPAHQVVAGRLGLQLQGHAVVAAQAEPQPVGLGPRGGTGC